MSASADWTERLKGAGDHQGRWALGLESMGFRITRGLLPPITNTTRRGRYYSFYCWVYWTFARRMERLGRIEATYAEQKAWRTRLENAFRTATALDPAYSHGLVGFNSRIPLTDGEAYPIGEDSSITAWQAEYYKPSWLSLGFGSLKGDIVKVDPALGVPLARAFDARVRAADPNGRLYPRLVSMEAEIPAEVIRTFASAIALRPLADEDEAERTLLLDRLFHLEPNPEPDALTRSDWVRSISLTLLLDLVLQGHGELRNADTAHYVFGTGRFPNGAPYKPPPVLQNIFAQWERYQERQQEKLALYAYWHEVLLSIRAAGGSGVATQQIVEWVLSRTEESEAVRVCLGDAALDLTVSECMERLETEQSDHNLLIQELTGATIDLSRPGRAGEAILLLLLLTGQWTRTSPGLPSSVTRIHTDAAPSELPLPVVSREILSRRTQPLRRLIRFVIEQWVLAQSLRVALEKWARNQDRFFIVRDADGYRIVRPQQPRYLEYDRPRIDSSLQILEDLRVISRTTGCSLTRQGEALHREAVGFHSERLEVPRPGKTPWCAGRARP